MSTLVARLVQRADKNESDRGTESFGEREQKGEAVNKCCTNCVSKATTN